MGLTPRGLRRKLAKLCSEGVLRPQSRGFRQTTIYTLMRLDEVVKHGDFLPLNGDASNTLATRKQSATSERNSRPSQLTPPFERTSRPSRERTSRPSQRDLSGPPGPPKEATLKEAKSKEESSPPRRSDSAAPSSNDTALIPACSKPTQNLPFRSKPETPDERSVSQTALRLHYAMGRRLPESWLHHQDLKQLIADRDFGEVCETIVGIGSNKLPEPEPFFEAYSRHLQEHKRGQAEITAELKALFPMPKPANNGTNGTRQAA